MGGQVFSLFRRYAVVPRDWSTQERAEFYRVESALIQAGLRVITDSGLTDEGDPWFVFCRAEDDEVIIHFARIDGHYLVSAPSYCGTKTDTDFQTLVRSVVAHYPVLQRRSIGDNLFFHPAALLVMLVASALLKSGHAMAAPGHAAPKNALEVKLRDTAPRTADTLPTPLNSQTDIQHETLIIAAMNAALITAVRTDIPTLIVSGSSPPEFSIPPHLETTTGTISTAKAQTGPLHGGGSLTPMAAAYPSLPLATSAHANSSADASVLGTGLTGLVTSASSFQNSTIPPVADWLHLFSSGETAINTEQSSVGSLLTLSKPELNLLQTLGITTDAVSYTNTVPVALSVALHSGHQIDVSPELVTQTVSNHASTAASAAAASTTLSSPVDAGGSVAAGLATSATPASATSDEHVLSIGLSDVAAALATVSEFRAIAVHSVAIVTPTTIIFYDATAVNTMLSSVTSVTYDFHDGLSISLVGLPAELAHAGVHL